MCFQIEADTELIKRFSKSILLKISLYTKNIVVTLLLQHKDTAFHIC